MSDAAKAAGRSRSTVYLERQRNEQFAAEWDEASEVAADELEKEALQRAVDGVARPIYQGGKLVGTERVYSDQLLMFLLRARRPAKFRERFDVTHGGKIGITLQRLHELAGSAEADDGS